MDFLTQGSPDAALNVTVAVVAATLLALLFVKRPGDVVNAEEEEDLVSYIKKIHGSVADFEKELPADRIFSLETLAPWDGLQLPMCIGVCGKVLDVSSSENLVPGFGYGELWAGKDATYALAHSSLKAEAVNVLDYDLSDWEPSRVEALGSWCNHFFEKYPIVGTLKEYDGRDFSNVLSKIESKEAANSEHTGGS
eukprot:TRINITY_DN21620_c0_g1_i1.p1 TRINITY_DN21620_c0_g1~~TRINITY_DN21620_c0_g1_i1.p1  ORF type:complete len:195 (+),score=33.03 TRINITY_DN21620_c0_g1_i1:60-644(+)